MIMKVENVVVSVSGYGTCLRWECGGFRYHIWEHTPETIFKNPPNSVQHRGPGYFPTRHLNPASKDNAAMLADARRIARFGRYYVGCPDLGCAFPYGNEQGLYDKATDAERQRKEDEKAETQAAIILSNKRKAAEEMYEALKEAESALSCITATAFKGHQAVKERGLDAIAAALAKADGKEL